MTKDELLRLALELPIDDRLDLAQAIWDSASPPAGFRLTPDLERLLDARLAEAKADPGRGITWEEMAARLRNSE
jgi:putative addiction module component (TIGR02574 family)